MKLSERSLSNLFRCEVKIGDIYLRNQCKIMNNGIQPNDRNCLTMTRTIKITYKPIEMLKHVATSHFHQECPHQTSQPAGCSPLRTSPSSSYLLGPTTSHIYIYFSRIYFHRCNIQPYQIAQAGLSINLLILWELYFEIFFLFLHPHCGQLSSTF